MVILGPYQLSYGILDHAKSAAHKHQPAEFLHAKPIPEYEDRMPPIKANKYGKFNVYN